MDQGDSSYVVSGISIIGNNKTKEKIILKELVFFNGDTLQKSVLDKAFSRSRENLLNTSLFNFVNITSESTGKGNIRIYVFVIERWYIWPSPIFEHAERNLGAFIHNPNWNRINYGGQILWYNFRGRNEQVRLKFRFGYKEQYELLYEKPNLGRNQKHGLTFALNTTRQHEVNINSAGNKPIYLQNENSYLAQVFNPYLIYTYRSSLYTRHSLTMGYVGLTYRDSSTHELFTGLPVHKNPGWFFGEYSFEYDFRDLKAYPLKGNYLKASLMREEPSTFKDDLFSKTTLLLVAAHHGELSERFFYNNALRLEFSEGRYEPKAYRDGLGYGQYLRGYELYVMDGSSYGILINNLKYCILQEHTYHLSYIPWSQFNPVHFSIYGNLFFDMAYVKGDFYKGDGNDYVNRFLYTAGLGLDFVSYYDQVLRLEISINRELQPGFFIHTEVPFGRW